MSVTSTTLPPESHVLIFHNLEFADLMSTVTVCKAWKKIVETDCFLSAIHQGVHPGNLVVDIPRDLVIDKDLSVTGALLIRAENIYSKPGTCLSGTKVTLVAGRIRCMGPIKAKQFDSYSNQLKAAESPGGSHYMLARHAAKPNLWSSLVSDHTRN